jgi:DNA-binding response OmpR family regulator
VARILVVEDCVDEVHLIEAALAREHEVLRAETLAHARSWLGASAVDLALVDLELPDGSGFALCTDLDGDPARRGIPVLFLTASSSVADKVTAFRLGAEDYIEKPFDPRELRARVDARLQRRAQRTEDDRTLGVGDLRLELGRFAAYLVRGDDRRSIEFTPHEFRIVCHLADRRDRVVARNAILKAVWGDVAVVARTIDTHLSNVRSKLRESSVVIESVRGVGYRLSVRAEAPATD